MLGPMHKGECLATIKKAISPLGKACEVASEMVGFSEYPNIDVKLLLEGSVFSMTLTRTSA